MKMQSETIKAVLKLSKTGKLTQKEIGERLGVCQSTVSVIQRQHGMSIGRGTWNQDPKKTKRLERLLASGKSQADVARLMGMSPQLVSYYAKGLKGVA